MNDAKTELACACGRGLHVELTPSELKLISDAAAKVARMHSRQHSISASVWAKGVLIAEAVKVLRPARRR